jgi:hypothetical protein
MRIDPLRAILFVTRMQAALANRPGTLPRGDAGLYVACREMAMQLERTNPLIALETGYSKPIGEDL